MSKGRLKLRSKGKTPGFSPDVIDHPWGVRWTKDQCKTGKKRLDRGGPAVPAPEPTPIIPGVYQALQWLTPLPERDVRDEHGQPIHRIVRGKRTDEVVEGFPAALNRPVSTPEEVEALRRERLAWVNNHAVAVATKQSGRDDYRLRPAMGAAEQVYGLAGLDLTILWRMGAQKGLAVEPWLKDSTLYADSLLRRGFGVNVYADYFHPGNPYYEEARGGFGDVDELGFGGHWQLKTGRALGGVYLTALRDFRRVGPSTCAMSHLERLGVDVHAYARARHRADQEWLYTKSTKKDWKRFKLKAATVGRIKTVQKRMKLSKESAAVLERALAKDLKRWDASFGRKKKKADGTDYVGCKDYRDVLKRNLATASENQPPVDYTLSHRVTRWTLREMAKDPAWAPLIERAQRCAREIETERWQSGFSKTLSECLFAWERREAESNRQHWREEMALYDEAFGTGAGVLAWSQAQAREEAEGELADLADAERREREAFARALEAERAAKAAAEEKAAAAESEAAKAREAKEAAERQAVEAAQASEAAQKSAREAREQMSDLVQGLAIEKDNRAFREAAARSESAKAAAPLMPSAPDWMAAVMRGENPPEAGVFFFEQRKSGTWFPGPGFRMAEALREVALPGVSIETFRAIHAGAKRFVELSGEYTTALKNRDALAKTDPAAAKVMWEKQVEAWKVKYPAPAPVVPVVPAVVERVVEKVVEREVIKTVPMPVDEAALLAKGEERGRLKFVVLPRLKAAVDFVVATFRGEPRKGTLDEHYVAEGGAALGGLVFTPEFDQDLSLVVSALPNESANVAAKAQTCAQIQAADYKFSEIADALEAKIAGRRTSDFVEEWFGQSGELLPQIAFAAEIAMRDARGPFGGVAAVQERVRGAASVLRLAPKWADEVRKRDHDEVWRDSSEPGEEWKKGGLDK